MKKNIFFLLLFSITLSINAQTKSEKNLGSWYLIYGTHGISKNWSILTGFEERNYLTLKNYNLTLYTLGVNYKLSKKIKVTLGYLYLDIDRTFDPDIDPNTIENRFYEQISYTSKVLNLPFYQRLRLEHRNLNTLGTKKNINRIRYRFKTKILIYKKLYLTASNESVLNFKGNFYSENRFYAAFGYKVSKKITFEVGYLGHYINNLHLDRLLVGFFFNTDFTKK